MVDLAMSASEPLAPFVNRTRLVAHLREALCDSIGTSVNVDPACLPTVLANDTDAYVQQRFPSLIQCGREVFGLRHVVVRRGLRSAGGPHVQCFHELPNAKGNEHLLRHLQDRDPEFGCFQRYLGAPVRRLDGTPRERRSGGVSSRRRSCSTGTRCGHPDPSRSRDPGIRAAQECRPLRGTVPRRGAAGVLLESGSFFFHPAVQPAARLKSDSVIAITTIDGTLAVRHVAIDHPHRLPDPRAAYLHDRERITTELPATTLGVPTPSVAVVWIVSVRVEVFLILSVGIFVASRGLWSSQ